MQIHLSGRVDVCTCRYTPKGVPVLVLEIRDDTGQMARVTHDYTDASNASGYAARALAARLRGQHIELDLINPRFRAKRLEATAPVIHTAPLDRKDLT